ncbi:hypothetical protein F53441_1129 [Fusarium austroafricanum]|uniref:Uncharacterized protein n=1 Tax=Fusarium austroafricanum TaxID=2364996 RepID=A0A8H4KT68_9HYPO|nr:hypothetical protein F53441_1129 [Fusarium austroafricanum]
MAQSDIRYQAASYSPWALQTPIRRLADLTQWELYELYDLVRAWVQWKLRKTCDMKTEPITKNQRDRFFKKVFKDWNSLNRNVRVPAKKNQKDKHDTTIVVGRWSDDLPLSEKKKRKIEEEE